MSRARGAVVLVGLAATVALGAGGCKKSSQNGTPTATSTATVAPPSSSATTTGAAAVPTKSPSARVCKLGPSVVASEGRGGNTYGVAASAAGIVVTWGELRHPSSGFGPEDAKQRFELARLFDAPAEGAAPAPPAPKGAAKEVGSQEAVDAFSNGIAPFALDDGTLGTGSCAWAAFAGKLSCGLSGLTAPAGAPKFAGIGYDDPGVAGPGPEGDRVAAAGVGDAAVMLMPQCQDVRIVSSAGKAGVRPLAYGSADALAGCEPKKTIEVPAITAISANEAAGVWRHANVIEGRLMGKDGMPHAGIVTVSGGGDVEARGAAGGAGRGISGGVGGRAPDVGAPAIAWTGAEARVIHAGRTGAAPWVLQSAHWKPGAPVTRAPLATGADPAMAPALVATDDPTCVLVSWTEGKGSATHVRAGLACGDAIVTASVVDVSSAGVEAGDSELARVVGAAGAAPSAAWIVWQELPKGKPAELKLARVTCE